MNTMVYWGFFKLKFLPGHEDYEKAKGCYTHVFYKTKDVLSYLEMIYQAFEYHKLKIEQVEFVQPFKDEYEWPTRERELQIKQLVAKTKAKTGPFFDDLHVY